MAILAVMRGRVNKGENIQESDTDAVRREGVTSRLNTNSALTTNTNMIDTCSLIARVGLASDIVINASPSPSAIAINCLFRSGGELYLVTSYPIIPQ